MSAPTRASTRASVVPGYIRPAPSRQLGLPAWGWTVLILVAGLGAIYISARFFASPLDILPVTDMISTSLGLVTDPDFLIDELGRTLGIIVLAFVLSSVLGVAAAYVLWRYELWDRAFQPYLNVYYAVPTFALYPIMVVLFGHDESPAHQQDREYSFVGMTAFQSILALFIGASGIWWNYRGRVQDQFEHTQSLLSEAHKGELASARHRIGSRLEGLQPHEAAALRLDDADTQSVFEMLWFFQRAWAVHKSMEFPIQILRRHTRAQAYLIDSLRPEIQTWWEYTAQLSQATGSNGKKINLVQSIQGLDSLVGLVTRV